MALGARQAWVLRDASQMTKLLDTLLDLFPERPKPPEVDLCFCCEGTHTDHEPDCPLYKEPTK